MTNSAQKSSIGWCLIPASIMAREDLTLSEKVILGRILGLTDKDGYCTASNKWLGKQIGLKQGTVSNIISKLSKKGLLSVKLIRSKDNRIKERRIFQTIFTQKLIPINAEMDRGINAEMEESIRDKSNREEYYIQSSIDENNNYKTVGEWQEKAVRYAERLGVKTDASWFKFFKERKDADLETAYRKTIDANVRDKKTYFYKVGWGLL